MCIIIYAKICKIHRVKSKCLFMPLDWSPHLTSIPQTTCPALSEERGGHLMGRTDSLEKTLMLGKLESRRRGRQRMRWLDWHHRLDGHGFGWTPVVGDGQGSLACCHSWDRKESDTTE